MAANSPRNEKVPFGINLSELPKKPGIYQFKDETDSIIYIGKAKDLSKRVKSYFSSRNDSIKTQVLVSRIKHVDVIVVNNEVEALLLENNLIKKHKPKYNIVLKDSKTYAYIKITNEKYPKIETVRKIKKDGAKYFGPYTDGKTRRDLIKLVTQIYKIRICRVLPKKPCLQYHLNLCDAPCINNISEEDYQKNVQGAQTLLKGQIEPVIKILELEMRKYSDMQEYERAQATKIKIENINNLFTKQNAERIKHYDEDVIVLVREQERALIVIINISKGTILSKKQYRFEYKEDLLQEFIKMYYSNVNAQKIPKEIITNQDFWEDDEDKQVIEEYLEKLKGQKVKITRPERGDKNKLILIAEENAKLNIKENEVLNEMKETLELEQIPKVIECFDASNLGSDHIVAGMTQFKDGEENKSEYRRFFIRTTSKQDDYKSIYEAVSRRYTRLKEEAKEMPNLIIIDGGAGQLRAAKQALKEINVNIPIISIAKQNEELYTFNQGIIRLDKNKPMMLLIRRIRDATHNLAISYNKKRRQMKMRDDYKELEKK